MTGRRWDFFFLRIERWVFHGGRGARLGWAADDAGGRERERERLLGLLKVCKKMNW